jgi:hypothetical protein
MDRGMIQVVEHLLSKYEALSSSPSTAKKKKKKKNYCYSTVVIYVCNLSTREAESGGLLI